jgi:hypothetical protein
VTKTQRYKYEMLVRVRDYGMAHRDAFPESSSGGERFAQVTAAVAVLDKHLRDRALGAAEARRVKATTRAAAVSYMKTIAQAARRVTRSEGRQTPFRLPRRRSLKADLAVARLFIEEAAKRQDQFVQLGMPSTFVSDFTALVDDLQRAVDTRLSSKTVRGRASTGIAVALTRGFDLVKDLDVVVAMAAREDPILAGAWAAARRIEGQNRGSADDSRTAEMPVDDAAADPVDRRNAAVDAGSPANSPPQVLAPVQSTVDVVGRSS